MIKHTVRADANNLLSLFNGKGILHPYRLQYDVTIVVPFAEYNKFIRFITSMDDTFSSLSLKFLACSPEEYIEYIRQDDVSMLKRLYLYDMAKSMLEELSLSLQEHSYHTSIVHQFDVEDKVNLFQLEDLKDLCNSYTQEQQDWAMGIVLGWIDRGDIDIAGLQTSEKYVVYYACFLILNAYYGQELFNIKM